MSITDLDFLRNVPLFRGLEATKLQALLPQLRRRTYRLGQVIFHQDDPGGQLYIVVGGQVRISVVSEDGREGDIALLQPGECFGEISLLDGGGRSATATAVVSTEALILGQEAFERFVQENPDALGRIARILCQRLRNADQLVGDLLFLDVRARLARQLLRLAGSHSSSMRDLVISVDQDQLARLVGASRETVNRVLRRYETQGVLRISPRKITIVKFKDLQAAAFTEGKPLLI